MSMSKHFLPGVIGHSFSYVCDQLAMPKVICEHKTWICWSKIKQSRLYNKLYL